ncbi:MAG: hypothetical protein MJ241_03215 [Bacilli bacterium]|nr:hypothetical protein [Bacilli bacterium]
MKANKFLLAATALALVGGVVACAPKNTVEFDLKTSAYSNDAKTDINYFLKLSADLKATLTFENTFSGNGAIQTIADGTWTVKDGKPASVTLGGNEQGIKDGYVQCYLSLNATGLIIAGEDDALIKLDFYFDETKKPAVDTTKYATVALADSYEHVTSVVVNDFSFTGGVVAAQNNKVEVGHFIALAVTCEEGYEVDAVTCNGEAAMLQSGMYCYNAAEETTYTVAITTKTVAA